VQLNLQVQIILLTTIIIDLGCGLHKLESYPPVKSIVHMQFCSCGVYAILTASTNVMNYWQLVYLILRQIKSARSTAVPRTVVVCRHFQLLSSQTIVSRYINLAIGPTR